MAFFGFRVRPAGVTGRKGGYTLAARLSSPGASVDTQIQPLIDTAKPTIN
jgi:hypothetical protein